MTNPRDSFDSLLNRVRAGDEAALRVLVEQYEPEVRLAARLLLGGQLRRYLDSVDLAQSVHFTLLRGLRDGKFAVTSPEKLVHLALTLVRRKVVNHWRRQQRHERWQTDSAEPTAPAAPEPGDLAAYEEAVARLLDQLEGTERQLMELRLQGYSTADVARELGLDADALRVRLGRLRQKLRGLGWLEDWL